MYISGLCQFCDIQSLDQRCDVKSLVQRKKSIDSYTGYPNNNNIATPNITTSCSQIPVITTTFSQYN